MLGELTGVTTTLASNKLLINVLVHQPNAPRSNPSMHWRLGPQGGTGGMIPTLGDLEGYECEVESTQPQHTTGSFQVANVTLPGFLPQRSVSRPHCTRMQ